VGTRRLIYLNQNESPIPPPPHVIEAAKASLEKINRYPDPRLKEHVTELASEYIGVDPEHVVLIPGADTIVDMTSRALKTREYIIPEPSFYDIILGSFEWNDVRTIRYPLDEILGKLENKGSTGWSSCGLIDNPNNPLGILVFTGKPPTGIPLIVDEAYYEYSGQTLAPHVREEENIAVIRTFSKAFSLAGLRIAAAVFPSEEASRLRRDPLIYRLTTPSLEALKAALEDPAYVKENVRVVEREKKRVAQRLRELGFKVYPSYTNFLSVETGINNITRILASRGVIVKSLEKWIKPGMIRVTIGLPSENDFLLSVMEEIISSD